MSAWDFARITAAKDAWAEARRLYPPPGRDEPAKGDLFGRGQKPRPKPHAIRADGTGPQFAKRG